MAIVWRMNSLISNPIKLAALVALMASACAGTGIIHGRLILPPAPTNAFGGHEVQGTSGLTGGAREAVVFAVSDHDRKPRPAKRECSVAITAKGFKPRILPIVVGTKVVFRNRDRVFHSVFSISPTKSFDLGPQAPGRTKSVTFDQVGIVNVYCELQPEAACFVAVLPHEHFTQPGANGEFSLSELEKGNYTVKAWHPIHGEATSQEKVPNNGKPNLRLRF
jgi:plastocyanin